MLFLLSTALATLDLTADNWQSEVVDSGKSALIKFYAPWCGHCKKLKPDWDKLADEYATSDKVLIADADCTAGGKPLCDKYGVRGYPTLKVFAAGDEEGEDYKGGRDLPALQKFASEMGPGCTVDNMNVCTAEQKTKLESYVAMDAAERAAKIVALASSVKDAESTHEKLLETLQAQYKASTEALEALKEEAAPELKLLKAASPKADKAAAAPKKDEV